MAWNCIESCVVCSQVILFLSEEGCCWAIPLVYRLYSIDQTAHLIQHQVIIVITFSSIILLTMPTPRFCSNSPSSQPDAKSSPTQMKRNPSKQPIHRNNPNKNANPFTRPPSRIPILLQHSGTTNLALTRKIRVKHAMAAVSARIDPFGEFVYHHSLEDVCLSNEGC